MSKLTEPLLALALAATFVAIILAIAGIWP